MKISPTSYIPTNNGIWQLYRNKFAFIATVVGATNAKPYIHGDNHVETYYATIISSNVWYAT